MCLFVYVCSELDFGLDDLLGPSSGGGGAQKSHSQYGVIFVCLWKREKKKKNRNRFSISFVNVLSMFVVDV